MSDLPNPLLRPPFYLIEGISPEAPISAQTEQIDQLNTLLLQEIDANFARFHQVVTTKLLPEIKRFAIASEPTRETSKFWRSFFEAAAAVRVHVPGEVSTTLDNTGALDQSTQYEDEDLTIRQGEDSELLPDGADSTSDASFFGAGAMSSTPMPANRTVNVASNPNASWESSMESPFERLGRRIRDDLIIGEESEGTPSLPSGYDLHAPSEASTSFGHLTAPTTTHGYGQPLLDLSIGSSLPESPLGPPTTITKLQTNSTPRASRRVLPAASPHHNPFQSPARDSSSSKWNGIADLRTTPLNIRSARAAYAPANDDDDDDDDDALLGFSPPVTMNFTMPVRPPKSQTPVKATARAVVESLLNQSAIDDEYDDLGDTPSPKPPTPSRWTMSAVPAPPPGSRDLFGTHASAGGNDSFDSGSGSDMSAELAQPSQTMPHPLSQQIYHDEGDSFDDDDSFDSNAERDDRPTLSPTTSEAGVIFGHVRDGPRGGRFDLMGPDELLTFHGGKLEDAEIGFSPTPMPHGGAFQKR